MARPSSSSYDEYAKRMDEQLDSKRKAEIAAMEAALRQNRASLQAIPSVNPCSEIYLEPNSIQNINIHDNSSAAANDIQKWIREAGTSISGSKITDGVITQNQIAAATISAGRLSVNNALSTSSTNVKIYNNFSQGLEVDFDEAVWTIQVPGITKDKIEVFTVKDRVYVEITGKVTDQKQRLEFVLAEDEKVTATKLDLGILSVTIDRPAKRQAIEIA